LAGASGGACFSGINWPQALHLAFLMPGGNLASLMVYFIRQFGQAIFIYTELSHII
jgi:hypothetical protein